MAVPPRPAATGPSSLVAAVPAPRSAPPRSGAPTPADPAADRLGGPTVDEVAGLAWIVREITHVPGVLRLRHGRLSFESTRGVLFDGTPADLDLDLGRSPRAGLRVIVGAERLRVCVVRPAGAVAPCDELVERAAGPLATSGGNDAWAVWRPLLAPQPATRTRTRVRRALAFSRPQARSSRACPS
jgi:hypothetical protein